MATEILGFLIIVGILIVFIVRRDLWSGTSSKADEVEEASVKMRLQMEHSANAIITQMDSRIHQLESLVTAADERARTLEQQMATVRAEQERAQQRAEKEFAEMRAARASFYAPREELPVPMSMYHDDARGRDAWAVRDAYRARVAAAEQSLRPIDGVSPVRRSEYIARVRPESRGMGADFAETLSASMHAEEAGNGAYRRQQADYYEHGQMPVYAQTYPQNGRYPNDVVYAQEEAHDAQTYRENYAAAPYPVEAYPEEETWEQYVEQPRRSTLSKGNARARRAQAVPAELAVEETPAVIVDTKMAPRDDVAREEPGEEPTFSQAQLEELARTEAEVVVSSSVADVVDLPMDSGEESMSYDGAEDEDVHVYAATDADEMDTRVLTSADGDSDVADENGLTEEDNARPEEQESIEEKGGPTIFVAGETTFVAAGENDIFDSEEDVTAAAESFDAEEEFSSDAIAASEEDEEEAENFEPEEEAWTSSVPDGYVMSADGTWDKESPVAFDETASEGSRAETASRPSSPTSRAKELLAQGMSPEEVAKETGMGRSAVKLLAQMAKEKLNSPADD